MRSCVALILAALTLPATASADDVLSVDAAAWFPVVVAGGFGEVSCTVQNHSDTPLRTYIEGHLRFEGTGRVRVLGPTVLEVPPGISFEIAPLFLVLETADPGPAEFTCRAHVAGPLPQDERRESEPSGKRGEATATFLVAE